MAIVVAAAEAKVEIYVCFNFGMEFTKSIKSMEI
jgi:hypothetical protein